MVAILDANLRRPWLKPRSAREINTTSRLQDSRAARLSRVTCLILAASRIMCRVASRLLCGAGGTCANIDIFADDTLSPSIHRARSLLKATSRRCVAVHIDHVLSVRGVDASVNDRSPVHDR